MNDKRFCGPIGVVVLIAGLSFQALAQTPTLRDSDNQGDWKVSIKVKGKQRTAILSLSIDADDKQRGQWIGFDELSELTQIKYTAGELRFTGQGPSRDGQSTTWKFNGTIKDGKLIGTIASEDRGEHAVDGIRIPTLPDIVGDYVFSYSKRGATLALAIRIDKKGKLAAHWLSGKDKVSVTDLAYAKGVLTFKSKLGSYKGGLTRAKALNGSYTTPDGREFSVLAQRLGAPLIGTWNLEVTSEHGMRKQRLKVNRDLSGWYGSVPIKEVRLKGDAPQLPNRPREVTFKTVTKMGERTVEQTFTGKVTPSKLDGEITTPTGSAKVLAHKAAKDL